MDTINLITRVSREIEPDAHESFLKLRGKERDTMRKRPSLLLTARLLCSEIRKRVELQVEAAYTLHNGGGR